MSSKDRLAAQRLQTALELADLADEMLRMRLQRTRPDMSEEELRAELVRWYEQRPGARYGDSEGVPGTWPRR